ncbi:ATP-citrate lyase [Gracilaria domingensis]|nr:ATP-citrate lyase [Gracilaria domingensis]
MARKKIREYDGKRLVTRRLKKIKGIKIGGAGVHTTPTSHVAAAQVSMSALKASSTPQAFYANLSEQHPWLLTTKLVVKPDMLFGKRGKNNLVLLNADYQAAQSFIEDRMGEEIEVSEVRGVITTFLIEPFVPHEHEFYMCIQTVRQGDRLSFGACGGIDIEENWDKVKSVIVPCGEPDSESSIDREQHVIPLLEGVDISESSKSILAGFITACFETYVELDMTLLEMNPFALDSSGLPAILDSRVELDSYASFKNAKVWGSDLEFPEPWGREKCDEERIVQSMDDKSSASLKLTVLNPNGNMWTMVAGGGASVIYADQVVQLGYGDELGNYAEYSGNPKEQETYLYARTLLGLVTRNADGGRRALLCGGGVANFSDIAATLGGLQQALTDFHGKLQMAKVKVFVRRGGPNYKAGLQLMRDLGNSLDIPIEVYGPETNMTHIVSLGIRWIEEGY